MKFYLFSMIFAVSLMQSSIVYAMSVPAVQGSASLYRSFGNALAKIESSWVSGVLRANVDRIVVDGEIIAALSDGEVIDALSQINSEVGGLLNGRSGVISERSQAKLEGLVLVGATGEHGFALDDVVTRLTSIREFGVVIEDLFGTDGASAELVAEMVGRSLLATPNAKELLDVLQAITTFVTQEDGKDPVEYEEGLAILIAKAMDVFSDTVNGLLAAADIDMKFFELTVRSTRNGEDVAKRLLAVTETSGVDPSHQDFTKLVKERGSIFVHSQTYFAQVHAASLDDDVNTPSLAEIGETFGIQEKEAQRFLDLLHFKLRYTELSAEYAREEIHDSALVPGYKKLVAEYSHLFSAQDLRNVKAALYDFGEGLDVIMTQPAP